MKDVSKAQSNAISEDEERLCRVGRGSTVYSSTTAECLIWLSISQGLKPLKFLPDEIKLNIIVMPHFEKTVNKMQKEKGVKNGKLSTTSM